MEENKEKDTQKETKEPQKGGILQKIREKLVLKRRMNETKERAMQRDPVTWHRILMAMVISYVGILVLVAVGFDYVMEARMDAYDRSLLRGDNLSCLPHGEYQVFMLFPSKANEPILRTGDIIVVAGKEGGSLLSVKVSKEVELPKDFYDQSCYTLSVSGDDHWEFLPTEHLDYMRNEMELRKKLYEDYQKEQKEKMKAAEQSSGVDE